MDSQSHEHKNQRFVDESKGLLTLQELDTIKDSKTYGEAERVIIQAGKGKEPALKDFLLVRDFLLTKFSLDTGTCPDRLNATIQEYRAGKVKDDCKVMLVSKHKRAKDGPAICPMLPELHMYMDIYVRRIRPLFAKENENALFLANEGVQFMEGTMWGKPWKAHGVRRHAEKNHHGDAEESKPSYAEYWHTARRPLGTGTHVQI